MGEYEKMLDSLRRLCSRRECCSSEIRRKIRLKGGLDEEAILSSLCKDGYLSDRRYASAFARDKSSLDGWGAVKIRYALKNKDIDEQQMLYKPKVRRLIKPTNLNNAAFVKSSFIVIGICIFSVILAIILINK